ncbi:uncharacterized protein LOC143153355 isoform X1 [Ptiloglossa arizonensis]|uniref:uncharacterized protein LOC143153355 isoform X1 n=1 Tax=Ptiloglossa arizonensis TaxID=3350558 RepID=UPI003F9F3EC5
MGNSDSQRVHTYRTCYLLLREEILSNTGDHGSLTSLEKGNSPFTKDIVDICFRMRVPYHYRNCYLKTVARMKDVETGHYTRRTMDGDKYCTTWGKNMLPTDV